MQAMPAVCAGQVQFSAGRQIWWCVTGEVVAESLFHMSATVSSLTTCSEGHRLAQLELCRRSTTLHTRISTCMTLRWLSQLWMWCDWCEVRRLKAATLVNKSAGQRLHEGCFAHSLTCVHLASRTQPVFTFLTRLEVRMFELRLWVLRETFGSQRACLGRKPAAFALIPDDEAWEVRSWVEWVLSLLVLSLTLSL